MIKSEEAQKQSINCPVSKKCGACQLQNMNYAEQLSWKQGLSVRNLGKFAHVSDIIGMNEPFHYRNKVQAAFGTTRSGQIISGVFQSSTHNIIKIDSCALEDKLADRIIVYIRKLLISFKLSVYNENTHKGFLRHVLIKRGFASGEVMVVLVAGSFDFPSKNAFLSELLKEFPMITTVVQNINKGHTSLVLGENQKTLYGEGYITDTLCGCEFRISPLSFYQINPVQTEILYSKAIEFAALSGKEIVLDAYCGIGTIGIIAAPKCKNMLSVEINPSAIRDAKINAKLNRAENINFFCADASDFMNELSSNRQKVDVVFMDPPRAGCDIKFLKSLCELSPAKLVYISCNPETLGRDLLYLSKNGYCVKKIQPIDMFPHTNHVECVCLLTKISQM